MPVKPWKPRTPAPFDGVKGDPGLLSLDYLLLKNLLSFELAVST